MNKKPLLTVRDVATLGIMTAVLEAAKLALDFLPNVELVTLLLMVYTIFYGGKTLIVALAFTLIECFTKGIHVWVIMYLYMWPLLILIVYLTNKRGAGHLFYCILAAFFGLFFGLFCSIPYLFIGGISMAFTWWIAGIPYDLVHCISNFILCLILFRPLCAVMRRVKEMSPQKRR